MQANILSRCTNQTDLSCVPHAELQSDKIHHLAYPGELSQFLSLQMHEFHPTRQKNQLAYELMLSLREEQYAITRSANNAQIGEIIDIDKCYITDPPLKTPWIQSDFITLDETEKRRIESGNWLTDDIIDAGQRILAEQFSARFGENGFQSVCLGNTYAFEVES